MKQWPANLPQYVTRDDWGEEPSTRYYSFPPEEGPPIDRPKGTMRLSDVSFAFIMFSEQVASFERFVADEIAAGTLPFTIEHPRRREQVIVRMTGEPRYSIRPFAGLEWKVSFRAMVIG